MTQLGLRTKVPFPATYKGFHLVLCYGRVYGIPFFLDPEEIQERDQLTTHPAILSAATKEALAAVIDGGADRLFQPESVGSYQGYHLIHQGGAIHGVPSSAGHVDLQVEEERRRAGVVSGQTTQEVQERLRQLRDTVPVEFAGWLPIFEYSGNCGKHPQFTHAATPPPGYRFTCAAPSPRRRPALWARRIGRLLGRLGRLARLLVRPFGAAFLGGPRVGLRARWRVLAAMVGLFVRLRRHGAKLGPILRFLQTRHLHSQLLLARYHGPVFLTSMPFTFGQNPWMVEIEDPTTLFYPLIQNGHTSDLPIAASPYFPIIKTLLESDHCLGILTHMKATAAMVPTLFGSETIRKKVHYAPLGVKLPERWQHHDDSAEAGHLELLFINSWCRIPENFFVRGGLDVLEAFAILKERYPHLRLTLRTNLPVLDDHYHRLIEAGWVRVIHRFLPAQEMGALLASSHIFLLPAARVHIVSLLQAMSYGLAVVASDGWGIQEYLTHEGNGLIVKGRYGKTAWADEQAGMLREDYRPTYTPDPEVVQGLVEAIARLVEDHDLRRRLGRTARSDVETKYGSERWNQALKVFFDHVLGQSSMTTTDSARRPEGSNLAEAEKCCPVQ